MRAAKPGRRVVEVKSFALPGLTQGGQDTINIQTQHAAAVQGLGGQETAPFDANSWLLLVRAGTIRVGGGWTVFLHGGHAATPQRQVASPPSSPSQAVLYGMDSVSQQDQEGKTAK